MTPPKVIWRPNDDFLTNSNIARFMRKNRIPDYRALLAWSVEDIRRFWTALLEDMNLDWDKPYDELLDLSGGFPWAKWFAGGETNIALNCLDRHLAAGAGGEDPPRLGGGRR